MSDRTDLEMLIQSRVPILAVESREEMRVLGLIRSIARKLHKPARVWSVTEGLRSMDENTSSGEAAGKPFDVLKHIKAEGSHEIFVLLDFHPYLKEAIPIRLLKDVAIQYSQRYCTVILLSHELELPEELRHFSGKYRLPLPDEKEIRNIVYDVAGEWGASHGQRSVEASNKTLDLLVRNLVGLTAGDARRLARNAIYDDGAITYSDIPEVTRAKYELLEQGGVLSFEYDTAKFSEVGGLRRLKEWLTRRKETFHGRGDAKLDPPKGVLLLGVQGCGKSLAAKAIAGIFGAPLLRLDFGALYNKYHGETEKNLRQSLQTAKVMAPAVLWIDEIEKGLGTSDHDGGTSRRVLGTLLTWMAENRASVFLTATANDIQSLPPELMRKGRFDEIFFVDLPKTDVRRQIFKIHLEKREWKPEDFDLDQLAEASDGFSGAGIEQAVVSAMYSAQADEKPFNTGLLLEELRGTRPLSVIMAERIHELRQWAAQRTVPSD